MNDASSYAGFLRTVQIPPRSQEVVMPFTLGLRGHCSLHESETRAHIARSVANLKGCDVVEEIPPALWKQRTYLIPCETLLSEVAQRLGVFGEDDLFGGVVPYAFAATKAITHPLVASASPAPAGWNADFPDQVRAAVLPGYTAFNRNDAAQAGVQLLALGPVRVKQVAATGGRGQNVATDGNALAACLAALHDTTFENGVVLEQNLSQVETLSVGQVRIAGTLASYHGRQRLTPDNRGGLAYGGSDLHVVRGDFHALMATLPSGPERTAVDQALVYDAAARRCFRGFFASRVNYDVAQGRNANGEWCSGVLEQSWRVGGATGAEMAALQAFHADPTLRSVRTSCAEIYGAVEAPTSATVYFHGNDPEVGPLTKYAWVQRDGDTA